MLVLFSHHCCGVKWTRCHFKRTTLPPNPAEVKKPGRLLSWEQKNQKAEEALGAAHPHPGCVWPGNQQNWNSGHGIATWLPETLHCKLPLVWPPWRAAPCQPGVWCFLKPGLFLEDKKKKRKKQQSAGICAVLPLQCLAWCLWWLGNRCLENNVRKMVVVQLDEFVVNVCVRLGCPHGEMEVFGDGAVGFCQVREITGDMGDTLNTK